MGKRNYFSWDKEEKFCPSCQTNIKLKLFRVVKKHMEYDMASRYCSICKDCENKYSKSYQQVHYGKSQGVRNEVNGGRS